MVFLKKVELRSVRSKYSTDLNVNKDNDHLGIFAMEEIKKDELISICDCSSRDDIHTREQLLKIINENKDLEYFIPSYSYMVDDDLYALPLTYMKMKNNHECAFFNHSCSPNIGFIDEDGAVADKIVACRDIHKGEELTYHYGMLETESSLIYNLECKCGLPNCLGRLKFDQYRDVEFVKHYYKYMTWYLKKKVNQMNERWHSTKCYLKRTYLGLSEEARSIDKDLMNECSFSLNSLFEIEKDELVASFKDFSSVLNRDHFISYTSSESSNCYLNGLNVFAKFDIEAEQELKLDFYSLNIL